ncbi:MAG: GAF domain-containing protein [bacterium]
MTEEINIPPEISDEEKYELLLVYADALINANEPKITSLANICALLKQTFDKISWVGFYFYSDNTLYLGTFQGKTACTQILLDKGVCGFCASKQETIIVPDVDKFPGHIACDSSSRSEIVVPLIVDGELFAVLDLDSTSYNAFNQIDKIYLEKLIELIKLKLDLSLFILS